MTTETVESYFRRNGVKYKRMSSGAYGVNLSFDCPQCGKKNKATINNATWLWQCFSGSCDAKGNELVLKRERGDIYDIQGNDGIDLERLRNEQFAEALAARAAARNDVERWALDLWSHPLAEGARDYLAGRGISRSVAEGACLGWSHAWPGREPMHDYGMLMIPVLTEPGKTETCAMVKVRSLNPDVPKSDRYRRLAGGESVLYAPNGIDPSKPIVLVGGEIDVLSVIQSQWMNVCCPTTGEGSWSDVYTKQLAACPDIVIIYDNDQAGRDGSQMVVNTLGIHRCRIGRWPTTIEGGDANDVLKEHLSEFDIFMMQTIVNDASVPKMAGIIKPGSLRDRIHSMLSGELAMGWPTGWADLDAQLGGWRPGEVTVVTGDTGCGKTSFTSQAAAYQAEHVGHGVLYAPLEMGPVRQMMKWMRQRAKCSPRKLERSVADGYITKLADLPLFIFYTREKGNIEAWRNTFWYARTRLNVRFVVLDHLHASVNVGKGEREELEGMSQMLAEVAVDTDMHIINVAHPHQLSTPKGAKDRDNVIVQLSDLKGTSAIKQFTDNTLSVWRGRKADRSKVVGNDGYGTSIVYLLKVRDEDGMEGRVPFRYDVEAALMLDDNVSSMFTNTGPKQHWTETDD